MIEPGYEWLAKKLAGIAEERSRQVHNYRVEAYCAGVADVLKHLTGSPGEDLWESVLMEELLRVLADSMEESG